ncbi:hypothetical protein THARTR1_10368 [Trichoderma harzianum]|uniref:Uncharacterized protein n=1 Tax=Trichoderma harzianum TaxID=5544 RepID=A0A2K0TRT2_TRIHA|nr:hypothetical protein THARTR1_10368 [Trichoderma harzianum]
MDHGLPEKDDNAIKEDYFATNEYFEDRESADSSKCLTAQGRSSMMSSRDVANQNNVDDATQAEPDSNTAVSRGDVDAIRSPIEDCQTLDNDGEIRERAFRVAIQGGHIANVKQLLKSGFDINSQDEYGQTALFLATAQNNMSMARYLIKSGIDVHSKDPNGLTALHVAIQKGNKDIISLLFTPTVDQKFTDDQCQEAISWAREQGQPEAVQILTELREKYESMLGRAQETFNIEDRAAAAQTVIQGHGWHALIDPLLEPLCFDLVDDSPDLKVVVCSVAFSHDGMYTAIGDERGKVKIFDVKRRHKVFQMDLETNHLVWELCFSPDGRSLVTASDNLVQVCNIATQAVEHYFHHDKTVLAVDASNDGRWLASCGRNGTVHVWDLEQGVEIKKLIPSGGSQLYSIKISPDGCFVAAGGLNGYVDIWNIQLDGSEKTKLHHGNFINSIAFSSDGKHLATGGVPSLKLWDLDTGACLSDFGNSEFEVSVLSITPDDRWIIAASKDGSIWFWDRTTGRSHRIFNAHKDHINCIAIRPLGGYFATASNDQTMRMWSYGPRKQT